MIDPLQSAMRAASSGMSAQSARMRVVSENIANAHSTGSTPGADPYARKTISFASMVDDQTGAEGVSVERIDTDRTPFVSEYNPGHPAADAKGYVKRPNVNPMVELADIREANRGYLANLQIIRQVRDAMTATIDLLRTS
jgi:flagellar basal-body rod protein FlgC